MSTMEWGGGCRSSSATTERRNIATSNRRMLGARGAMGEFGTGAGAHEQPPGRRGGLAGRRGLLVTLVAVAAVLVLFIALIVANGGGAPSYSQAPPAASSKDAPGSPPPGSFVGKLLTFTPGGYQVLASGPDGKLAVTLTIMTSQDTDLFVSPDRRTIAYPRDGGLYVRALPDGPERKLAGDWPDRDTCLK